MLSDLISFSSYIASDMEEDSQAPKQAMLSFLYGKSFTQRPLFHRLRLQLVKSMYWNLRVSREECEEVHVFGAFGAGGMGSIREQGNMEVAGGIWEGGERMEVVQGQGVSLASPHVFWGCFFFQIQAYNPGLWVWSRDRTLLPTSPGTQDACRHLPVEGMNITNECIKSKAPFFTCTFPTS